MQLVLHRRPMTTGAHNRLLLLGLDHMRSKDPPISLATASLAAACAPITEVDTLTLNTAACSGPDILHAVRHKCEGLPERAVVGIGAYIWAEALLNPIVAAVREASPKGTQIVLGGPQISDASEAEVHTFYPGVDHFARGSGEPILLRLLRGQAPDVQPAALSKEEVSSLPSPLLTGWMQPQAFLRWETQRGCPFACSFCQHPSAARKRRFIALDRVLAEAELLCDSSRSGVLKSLAVVDPTFNSGEHSIQVLRALTRGGFKARLSLQCRVEMLTDDFVSAVAELERTSQVTLEFGIQSIHRVEQRAVQRPTNMRKVARWLERLNSDGIRYELTFIYGLPQQTLSSFGQSVDWASNVCAAHSTGHAQAKYWPLMLLRGTPLAREAQSLGLITSSQLCLDIHDRVGSGIPHVVASPTFTTLDWFAMHDLARAAM